MLCASCGVGQNKNNASDESGALSEVFDISWDYYVYYGDSYEGDLPSDSKITKRLNERFNARISSETVPYSKIRTRGFEAFLLDAEKTGVLPDIVSMRDIEIARFESLSGNFRKIPLELIERHAPRYASALSSNPALLEPSGGNENEVSVLLGVSQRNERLDMFSVYRLDWLEAVGMEPKGEPYEVWEGAYFTEEAFTQDEFLEIMRKFEMYCRGGDSSAPMRLAFNLYEDFKLLGSLSGMFGFGLPAGYTVFDQTEEMFFDENGAPVLWFAGNGFKSFLLFFEDLIKTDAVRVYQNNMVVSGLFPDETGWRSMPADHSYMSERLHGYTSLNVQYNPSAKFLVTPPEIGPDGSQGAVGGYESGYAHNGANYMVGAGVDDSKLARILEIFEAVSFDPDTYMLAHYGVEGDDYAWSGAPFESEVRPLQSGDPPMGMLGHYNTGGASQLDDIFVLPSRRLINFATGASGRAMIIKPYDMANGLRKNKDFHKQSEIFEGSYWNIFYAAQALYVDVANGGSATDQWDAYAAKLEELGVEAYTRFYFGN